MDEGLKFKFTEDRFGFSSESDTYGPTYARDIEAALSHLRGTIETLFGSPAAIGVGLLGEAGLLPRYPDWEAIERMLRFISDFNKGAIALQGESLWNDSEGRRILLNLRDYLRLLQDWAPVLKLGIWASLVASAGSVDASPLARRRRGVRTVGNIFRFELADPTQEIFPRLIELTQAVDVRTRRIDPKVDEMEVANRWAAENSKWLALFARGSELTTGSVPLFSDKPISLKGWLAQIDDLFEEFLDLPSAAISTSGGWFQVELDYWDQWVWSNDGPPKRNEGFPRVSVVDLMYTACHGGIPFVPSTGGNLSIAQWSRILSEAVRRSIPTQHVKDSAASNLGISELRSLTRAGEKLTLAIPIIAVCPRSAQSRASAWQPQSGTAAVALPPHDVQFADALAERAVMGGASGSGLDPLGEALRDQTAGASITQFIEVDDEGTLAGDASAPIHIARPSISLFYFGFGRDGKLPFIAGPRAVSDLLKIAQERHSPLLPSDLEGRSFWAQLQFFCRRIWYRLRRSVRRLASNRANRAGSGDV